MLIRKVSFKTVTLSSPEKLKKTKRDIFLFHPLQDKKGGGDEDFWEGKN